MVGEGCVYVEDGGDEGGMEVCVFGEGGVVCVEGGEGVGKRSEARVKPRDYCLFY